ncbi:MAG: 23S rRNA (uracil(1939)-C(5))-methyltransferase RlmD [Defluviitaleaceae bacterium]|nr:23S rRNA (uracil(1939)-C(5))-methyltransferase RlmD [Defluviitaleaceae bacterium]
MIDCPHFGRCGGCTYLDIPYAQELAQKKEALRETLGPYGHFIENIIPAPLPVGYRNKMELAFGDEAKDGQLALGMRKRRSYYEVASVENCVLIPEDFRKIALTVQDYFRDAGEPFFHRKRHIGSLRHLVLRRGEFTGELLIILSTTSNLKAPIEPLLSQIRDLKLDGKIVGILHCINDGVADVVKEDNTRVLVGQDYYHEKICGLAFRVSAFSFFQTNSAGAEKLYGVIRDMAETSTGLAYDLYCGTGTISQVLSPNFTKVMGIELNPDAIEAARDNVILNGISNCEFFSGDVQELLDGKSPDIAIVDPPRDGLHPRALAKLIAMAPPRLIYVSCKPASLARDLVGLTEAGYTPRRAIGVDMFPRTPHVEAVMLLERD